MRYVGYINRFQSEIWSPHLSNFFWGNRKPLTHQSGDLSIKHWGVDCVDYPMWINFVKQNGSEIVLCFNGKMLQDALSWRSRLGWPVCMVIGGIKGWEDPRFFRTGISIWDTIYIHLYPFIGCHIFLMFRFTTCFFKVDGQRLATIYGIRVTRDLEWWNEFNWW